jgi:excisionase family DNA binding protein
MEEHTQITKADCLGITCRFLPFTDLCGALPENAGRSPATEPLLSEAEAAHFLGVSKMTMLRRRQAGVIGFYRVGFRVLYSKEKHLLPFLTNCEKGSSQS